MNTRLCKTCKKELPESEFHASELQRDYSRCKGCRSAQGARAYKAKLARNPKSGPRLCWDCERTLPESAFYADQLHRGRPRCKECKKSQISQYHRQLKEGRKCFHCRVPLEKNDESLCKLCKARARKKYHENGDERRAGNRERKRRLKAQVFDAYGGPKCVCCGEETQDFLSIDHINDDGADHRRELKEKHGYIMDMYRWLKNHNFPEGFQVLCFNCNFAKGHFGICPHEVERRRDGLKVMKGNRP